MSQTLWCEHAAVNGTVESGVTIAVTDGRFEQITANTVPSQDATRLDGFTVPGFANAHSHAFHRALRSRVQAERGSFWTWREIMYEAAGRLTPDNYHALARAVFAEMALAGISVVGEFHYLHHDVDGTAFTNPNEMGRALLSAADDAGIRITLLDTLYLYAGMGDNGHREIEGVQHRFSDRTAEQWSERVSAIPLGERQRLGAAIHSVRAVDRQSMTVVAEWAQAKSAPVHAHVSEQVAENEQCQALHGCTPTELLHSTGVFDANFTAVHATHLTDHDIELLGSSGCAVCMCPTTERDLGDGIGPTPELASAGVRLALGSDSHAVIDQMIEARAVELDERLRSQSRGIHSAPELLDMATSAGHRSLGWDDAGAIAVGNRADLTTISLITERTAGTPPEATIEAAVFASTASDITSVIIDGRQVVSDGRHKSIDVPGELDTAIRELFA